MKVIIPVAGAGAKLRPFTYTQPKCLIPLAGKTILSFIIDELLDAGITDFIFIIGHLGEKIKDFVTERYPQLHAEFVVQMERDGTGHAISLAEPFIENNEPVIVVYGDTICDNQIKKIVDHEHSCFGIKKVEDPRNFGVVELDDNGRALHVVEKPSVPKSNMALVGIYKIIESKLLFKTLKQGIASNTHIEKYQLTNAIESMIQGNVVFDTFIVDNWYDCGKKESLLNTNANILKKLEFASDEVPFFDNTIIIHPVSIADGCNIQNSIIGPNVTIGENASIESSIISDSIIGSYSELRQVVLHKSLIGSDAFVNGYRQSLNIGDNTEIDLQL
jgi:glucose-1-phosphate thymidylyltransferase